jgi:hypothetical protein
MGLSAWRARLITLRRMVIMRLVPMVNMARLGRTMDMAGSFSVVP